MQYQLDSSHQTCPGSGVETIVVCVNNTRDHDYRTNRQDIALAQGPSLQSTTSPPQHSPPLLDEQERRPHIPSSCS